MILDGKVSAIFQSERVFLKSCLEVMDELGLAFSVDMVRVTKTTDLRDMWSEVLPKATK